MKQAILRIVLPDEAIVPPTECASGGKKALDKSTVLSALDVDRPEGSPIGRHA